VGHRRCGDNHRASENSPRKCSRPFGDLVVATVCGPETAATVLARFAELLYPLDVHSGYVVPSAPGLPLTICPSHAKSSLEERPLAGWSAIRMLAGQGSGR
jgi:hypothetical protein